MKEKQTKKFRLSKRHVPNRVLEITQEKALT